MIPQTIPPRGDKVQTGNRTHLLKPKNRVRESLHKIRPLIANHWSHYSQ